MARLRFNFENIWNAHVELYKEVFGYSLQQLAKQKAITGDEDSISTDLWKHLQKTCRDWAKERDIELPCPKAQCPAQDIARASLHGLNALKLPDFSCFRYDKDSGTEIAFHIECKRLGSPTSKGWILNKNYVEEGIKRFDLSTHKYGDQVSSGMMVGYIVSMTPEKIQAEVNQFLKKQSSNYPEIEFKFDQSNPFITNQEINRQNVLPSKFELFHLWADIRSSYHK